MKRHVGSAWSGEELDAWRAAGDRHGTIGPAADGEGGPRLSLVAPPDRGFSRTAGAKFTKMRRTVNFVNFASEGRAAQGGERRASGDLFVAARHGRSGAGSVAAPVSGREGGASRQASTSSTYSPHAPPSAHWPRRFGAFPTTASAPPARPTTCRLRGGRRALVSARGLEGEDA